MLQYAHHDKSNEWAVWEAGHATVLALVLISSNLCSKYIRALIFWLCRAMASYFDFFLFSFLLSANGCAAQWPPARQGRLEHQCRALHDGV